MEEEIEIMELDDSRPASILGNSDSDDGSSLFEADFSKSRSSERNSSEDSDMITIGDEKRDSFNSRFGNVVAYCSQFPAIICR